VEPCTWKVGSECVVGRESSKQPPWSIAMSTRTEPSFIPATISLVTRRGARAPGISTDPITRSASVTCWRIASADDVSCFTRPCHRQPTMRSFSRLVSSTVTSAPMPSAMFAAFWPATPPPSTTTRALATPPMPPMRTPRPPWGRMSEWAPTCGARQPATSDIG